jgi:hypothetical protein
MRESTFIAEHEADRAKGDADNKAALAAAATALALPQPYRFALEKALRRHAVFRTGSAEEMWKDLHSPVDAPRPVAEIA